MYWGPAGDTFIIRNVEEFVNILPRYFKTKNYSSFVRQLNMYDFHKVKNAEGYNEFKHPKFKKGNFNDLPNIKRKINEFSDVLENFKGDQKIMLNEYNKLKKNYEEIEESLNIVASQNKRLVEANKELVCKLYYFKKEYETRIKKVLFCFHINNIYHDEKLNSRVKVVLEEAQMLPPQPEDEINCLLLCHRIQLIVKQFAKRLIFSPDKNSTVLDKLVQIYIEFLNDSVVEEKMVINYKSIINDMFADEQHDDDASPFGSEPLNHTGKRNRNSIDVFVPSAIRADKDYSLFNKMPVDEGLSNVDSKSESFNEEDLLGEITRKLANSARSINDSFIASDAQSLNIFSPMSEKSEMLRF